MYFFFLLNKKSNTFALFTMNSKIAAIWQIHPKTLLHTVIRVIFVVNQERRSSTTF